MASQPVPRLSYEDYLRQEQRSDALHEYHDGELFEMEAASPHHERICIQLGAALLKVFPKCGVYGSKLHLYLEKRKKGVYPDATVICGELETIKVDGLELAVKNPHLLVEVRSPSSAEYDEGKATWYREIPSVEHILLISQNQVLVEHFRRDHAPEGSRWIIDRYDSISDEIRFGQEPLRLAAVYKDVDFLSES